MANTKQAPILHHGCSKQQVIIDTKSNFYQVPQSLADIIFKQFPRDISVIKLMIVLVGTKEGFGLSKKWVMDRTQMTEKTYYQARQKLIDAGWLELSENNILTINYDAILATATD